MDNNMMTEEMVRKICKEEIAAHEAAPEDAAEDKKEGPASMEELKAKRDEVLDSKEE